MDHLKLESLKDKVCVITGGGGVIGEALSLALSKYGVKMAILDLSKELADKAAERIYSSTGTQCIGVEANVLERESLEKAKAEVNDKFGKVNILINCAGGNSPKATTQVEFMETSDIAQLEKTFFGLEIEGFKKVFDLNFIGTILPTMIFSKDMLDLGEGNILNISSMNSFRPLTKIPAYSAAKASINNLTEWLAVHFAHVNIRVNAIAPGFFVTNQNRFLLMDEKTKELTPRAQRIINGTPMKKFGEPEDLQGATLFLTSDLSKFITGVVLPVDGGFNIFSGV